MPINFYRDKQRFIQKLECSKKDMRRVNPIASLPLVLIDTIFPEKQTFYLTSGIINSIWQDWNKLCLRYWELHMFGGYISSSVTITGIFPSNQLFGNSIYLFLKPTHSRYSNQKRTSIPHYGEPTWGCLKSLSEIGNYYYRQWPDINNLLSALSLYGNDIEHIQIIRNACFHLNKNTMNDVKTVALRYSLSRPIKYPTDLAFSQTISSGQLSFDQWCDSLVGITSNLHA